MSESTYRTEWLQQLRKLDLKLSFVSTLDTVEKFGWEAMLITGCNQRTSFAYTVGLRDTMGFPEVIVVGLKQETAHRALKYAVEAMRAGADITSGRLREIIGEVEVEFRPVSQKWFRHIMCRADWYYGYGESEIPSLQLIYPDLENRFQWEDGFTEYFRQPLLQPAIDEGRVERDFWASNDLSSSLSNWKFTDDPHRTTFLSQTVFKREERVTYVSHDENGDWQFLGYKTSEGGDAVTCCLHHLIDDDRTLEVLHDLPLGWYATRESPEMLWERFESPPEPDEDEQ